MSNEDSEYYIHSAALDMLRQPTNADVIPEYPSLAQIMFENVVDRIRKFESALPNELQAAGNIVTGPGCTFLINKVSYMEPDIILFSGLLPDGAAVELVQHISQLNLLLTALPRKDDISKPRREIGFHPIEQRRPKP